MNKNLVNFIATIAIAYVLSLFFPWWSVMVTAFVTSFIVPLKKSAVFVVPFLSIAILWVIQSWLLSSANDYILAKKIAALFPLAKNPFLLILVSGFIGGIAAGVAAVFGKQCLIFFKKPNT